MNPSELRNMKVIEPCHNHIDQVMLKYLTILPQEIRRFLKGSLGPPSHKLPPTIPHTSKGFLKGNGMGVVWECGGCHFWGVPGSSLEVTYHFLWHLQLLKLFLDVFFFSNSMRFQCRF